MKKKNKTDKLMARLEEVRVEFALSSLSYAAMFSDGEFMGALLGSKKPSELFDCVCGIGRLWQYARETTLNCLNQYDKLNCTPRREHHGNR